ncbi:MAG: ferrochelatase [Candidatus Promineifilaceae bacterium]|jgi:ferrochelatase
MKNKIGVLIMAYGGPESLDEIPGYLADIRSGRPTTSIVLDEITSNYRKIGGKSPLLEFTTAQIEAIKAHLDPEKYQVYLGMRHWAPWIEEVVGQMVEDGIQQAVSMVLAPHFSSMSIAKYQKKIQTGLELYRGDIEFKNIDSYHDVAGLIDPLAARVEEGLSRWDAADRDAVHVVFSAHSLPVRIIKEGDPYDMQLRETANLVAEKAGLKESQWSWSYQSAGRSPEPWLGPQLEDYVPELAAKGIKNIVSIPVGFVCDHVEILFDIDIEAQAAAQKSGVRLERPPALNTDPVFMKQLADLIEAKALEF